MIASLSLLALAGCGKQSTTPNITAQPTPQITTINIADIWRAGLAPLYVAQEKKLFDWIQVNIIKMPNIGDQRVAMQTKNIDIYQGTYDMFLSTDGLPAPGIGFMAGDESNGADWIITKENITSIVDLKGKSIAVEKGTPAFLLLQYIAMEKWLTLADFDIQYMPVADAATAFIAGKVDAAGTYEPYITNARNAVKWVKLLSSSSEYPGLFPAIYFAREDLIQNNPEVLAKLIKGRNNALTYIASNPDESYAIMAKAYGLSTGDMYDIKSGIIWHTIAENKAMFTAGNTNNVFDMYTAVQATLGKNSIKTTSETAQAKLTPTILNLLP